MRLIDADPPMEQMEKLLDHHLMMGNFSADGAVSDCIEFLKIAPTIDADPVVHGKWIVHNQDNPFTIYGECPLCHEEVGRKWNYCPNCGARMDGEEE